MPRPKVTSFESNVGGRPLKETFTYTRMVFFIVFAIRTSIHSYKFLLSDFDPR